MSGPLTVATCPHCHANLASVAASGEPLLRARGVILKATGLALVCPRCRGDVPLSQSLHQQIHQRVVLFFRHPT